MRCDVAIIGGGPGGLHMAWRLAQAFPSKSIIVLEATRRFGGRVKTLRLKEVPFSLDIGAMRLLREQVFVNALVKRFKLDTFEHKVPIASYFLRNKPLLPYRDSESLKQFDRKSGKPVEQDRFDLDPDMPEARIPPGDLLQWASWKILASIDINDEDFGQLPKGCAESPLRRFLGDVVENELKAKQRSLKNSVDSKYKELSFDYFTVPEWIALRQFGRIGGRRLHEYSVWELVRRQLSAEGFRLARSCLGYQTIFGAWNAAEHIPWFLAEFGTLRSDEGGRRPPTEGAAVSAIKGGMSELTEALERALSEFPRVTLLKNHEVEAVGPLDGSQDLCVEVLDRTGRKPAKRTIVSAQLVLSVSRGALSHIKWSPELRINKELLAATGAKEQTLNACLNVVAGNPLMKAFALYRTPWYWEKVESRAKASLWKWNRVKLSPPIPSDAKEIEEAIKSAVFVGSRVITDLPVRQLYFHGPADGWWRPKARLAQKIRGMIMAYCDANESEYWARLWRRSRAGSAHEASIDADIRDAFCAESRAELAEHGVSFDFAEIFRENVDCALRDLFDGETPKEGPVALFFQDWRTPPFHGGWHAWNMGCDPQVVRRLIQKPFDNANLYICGEAFSADQGWIEGALRTSEAVLQNHLGAPVAEHVEWKRYVDQELAISHYRVRSRKKKWTAEEALALYLSW